MEGLFLCAVVFASKSRSSNAPCTTKNSNTIKSETSFSTKPSNRWQAYKHAIRSDTRGTCVQSCRIYFHRNKAFHNRENLEQIEHRSSSHFERVFPFVSLCCEHKRGSAAVQDFFERSPVLDQHATFSTVNLELDMAASDSPSSMVRLLPLSTKVQIDWRKRRLAVAWMEVVQQVEEPGHLKVLLRRCSLQSGQWRRSVHWTLSLSSVQNPTTISKWHLLFWSADRTNTINIKENNYFENIARVQHCRILATFAVQKQISHLHVCTTCMTFWLTSHK